MLYGVKHLPGDDCLGILSQATTLYVHVLDTDTLPDNNKKAVAPGSPPPPGAILRSGIVKIGAGDVISLIASMRLHGGTLADQIEGILTFGLLLLGDIAKNCLARGAYETDFWCFWASDGDTGVLLDMVKRPARLELRLAQFANGSAPVAPVPAALGLLARGRQRDRLHGQGPDHGPHRDRRRRRRRRAERELRARRPAAAAAATRDGVSQRGRPGGRDEPRRRKRGPRVVRWWPPQEEYAPVKFRARFRDRRWPTTTTATS